MSLIDAYITKKSNKDRENNDFYPTPPIATLSLLKNHDVPLSLWEPAAGKGHITKELKRNGHEVFSSDLYEYENPLVPDIATGVDFLKHEHLTGGVITNPPFKHNLPEKLLGHLLDDLDYPFVAFFLRLTFMESLRRYELFKKYPPTVIYVLSGRVNCHEKYVDNNNGLGGMVAYAWFVWDKRLDYTNKIEWIRPSDYIKDL